MRLLAAAVVLALALTGSFIAPPSALYAEAKAGKKIVCKHRQRTGTRFKTKMCKTAEQWEEMAEQGRSGIKELVDRPHMPICGPNGC